MTTVIDSEVLELAPNDLSAEQKNMVRALAVRRAIHRAIDIGAAKVPFLHVVNIASIDTLTEALITDDMAVIREQAIILGGKKI